MLAWRCGSLAARPVLIAELGEPGVALPPVRVDDRTGSGGGLHEPVQRVGRGVIQDL